MARLQLNKSSLANEMKNLQTYQRFLPSLDLKRQQLMAEKADAIATLEKLRKSNSDREKTIGKRIPMLANLDVSMDDVVRVESVQLTEENVLGTILPVVENVTFTKKKYSLLTKPHWVDNVVAELTEHLNERVKLLVQQQRVERLDEAVVTITQRVNLFDKVLIPKTLSNIKRIKIFLSDAQMAAVVRAKIAKKKRISREIPES